MRRKTHKAVEDPRLTDLKVATATIGDTAAERLAWIVAFSAEQPKRWHSAERSARGDCLHALAHGGFPANLVKIDDLPAPLDGALVESLHGEIRKTLRALVTAPVGRTIFFPYEGVSGGLVRCTDAGTKPATFASTYGHRDARSAVLHKLRDLVLQAGDRLLACPTCREPFVAVHKQKFCSKDCGQRDRNDRKAKVRFRKRGQ